MAKNALDATLKEKFRPDESALDREVDDALAGLSLDALYNQDNAAPTASPAGEPAHTAGGKGPRRGKIISIGRDDVFVDFGGKSQGVASQLQFEAEPKVGDEFDFFVERYDAREGLLVLSRKGALATNVSWDNLEAGQIVEGTVSGTNKGGLELDVKGMRAFMPAGQVDLYHVPDLTQFVGQKIQAEVTQFEPAARNLVLSRRNILEREREAQKAKLMEELAEGQVRRGTVRNVMDFGAFVDLGGVDGLLHVSEMTFKRGRHNATDYVKVGDVLDVKITRIDKETGKLSLSLKQARGTDPWTDAATKYAVGTEITGRVVKLESFGAFIEVEEGLEGLLPISEMSWQRIRHPSDVAREGDTVRLVVLSVDPAQRRISFSLKQAGPDPWKAAAEKYAVGQTVTGQVTRTADFGAFVELEPGLEGLVHVSELSNQRVRTPTDVVKIGQELSVRILEIDAEGRRMSLSARQSATGGARAPAKPGAPGAAPAAPPPTPATKKKRPQLRGGLEF
jgi:small subunit ribosomal protein S1